MVRESDCSIALLSFPATCWKSLTRKGRWVKRGVWQLLPRKSPGPVRFNFSNTFQGSGSSLNVIFFIGNKTRNTTVCLIWIRCSFYLFPTKNFAHSALFSWGTCFFHFPHPQP